MDVQAEERRRRQETRRVQFSGAEDGEGDEDEAPRPREPVLPQKSKKKQKDKRKGDAGMDLEPSSAMMSAEGAGGPEGAFKSSEDARAAAALRAEQRSKKKGRLGKMDTGFGSLASLANAEEEFQGEDEERDAIEPFNLNQEREEGYYDAEGNYVEYKRDAELHDAWLDSAEVEPRLAAKAAAMAKAFEESEREGASDLSRQEQARIRRRIADILQPGETVLQGLRRLGGSSKGGAGKAASKPRQRQQGTKGKPAGVGEKAGAQGEPEGVDEGTKKAFEQLTDDAFKLMDSGETDVYSEKRETFLREAEGYEALERARSAGAAGPSSSSAPSASGSAELKRKRGAEGGAEPLNIFGEGEGDEAEFGPEGKKAAGAGAPVAAKEASLDMFGDEGEGSVAEKGKRPRGGGEGEAVEGAEGQGKPGAADTGGSGYAFDEASGYYYNADVGYYYDPSSGLFCSATTGKWYTFDENKNEYIGLENEQGAAPETDAGVV